MRDYLVNHAIKNVWCSPEQDRQLVFRPARLTWGHGALGYFSVLDRTIALPTNNKLYSVFQVGQIHPAYLKLLSHGYFYADELWRSFSENVNNKPMFCQIYNQYGVMAPLSKTYYMFTRERCLLFCVEQEPKIDLNYNQDLFFFRFYTNAYYSSIRNTGSVNGTSTRGMKSTTNQDIVDMQNEIIGLNSLGGKVFCYCNGYRVKNIDLLNCQAGDYIEYVRDASVKESYEFRLGDLASFTSTLDLVNKYLIHTTSNQTNTIDFEDDIDVYIAYKENNNKYKALAYPRNNQIAHRMVTHKDYSLSCDFVLSGTQYLDNKFEDFDTLEARIIVEIRHSGFNRPLIYDSNRIFELYKLDYNKRQQALLGTTAGANNFRAETLEHSRYNSIMGYASSLSITMGDIQDGYGYNSISKILADTPIISYEEDSIQKVQVPVLNQLGSSVFEYDADGYLIEVSQHLSGSDYECINSNTRLVDMRHGTATNRPDVKFGYTNIPITPNWDYRVYMCTVVDGVPNQLWVDITGQHYYRVESNMLIWQAAFNDQYLMVRSASTILQYELEFNQTNGNLFFTLYEEEDRGSGYIPYVMPVPPEDIDLFIFKDNKGRKLVKNIHYKLDFPKVYIIGKEHVQTPFHSSQQRILVRCNGFCDSQLRMREDEDIGFVEHNRLSNNHIHDIRDDKVLSISVNGKVMHRSSIEFSENNPGVNTLSALNGKPYEIKDLIIHLHDLVNNETTYTLRQKSRVIDNQVKSYMTQVLPQPDRPALSAIPNRNQVVSPFFARVISALYNDEIEDSDVLTATTNFAVRALVNQFEYLLQIDPITQQNRLDENYVIVHPTFYDSVMLMSIYKIQFLHRVVQIYGQGLIDVAPFVAVN